jgi:hypothetical protein
MIRMKFRHSLFYEAPPRLIQYLVISLHSLPIQKLPWLQQLTNYVHSQPDPALKRTDVWPLTP